MVRLACLLDGGGLLVLTGAEPFEPCLTEEQEIVRDVLRWREAMIRLTGEEPYRECPAWWVAARLREQELEVEEPCFSAPVTWSLGHVRKLAESGVARAAASGDTRLAAFARRRFGALCRKAARLPGFAAGAGPVRWTRDWVLRIRPKTKAEPVRTGSAPERRPTDGPRTVGSRSSHT